MICNGNNMFLVAPQLADNVESRHLSIGVGSSLELPCPVKSLEQHSTLSLIWILPSRNRLSVDNQQSGNFNFVQDSNTLLMRDARLSDTGEYQCYASNLAGRVTFIWNISVKGKSLYSLLYVYINMPHSARNYFQLQFDDGICY